MAGACECGDEHMGSIKCEEFLGQLSNCKFLKKDFIYIYIYICFFGMKRDSVFVYLSVNTSLQPYWTQASSNIQFIVMNAVLCSASFILNITPLH